MTVWDGVDALIDVADERGLRAHGVHLLAARRWRALGRPIPDWMRDEERQAGLVDLAAEAMLRRLRELVPGPFILLKGPDVAWRYPARGLRPYRDLDLLTPCAIEAERVLLAVGFVQTKPAERFASHHHRAPLALPGHPLPVELHTTLPGPVWMAPPSFDDLLGSAISSACGVDGVKTLPPAHHAVVLAAHSWSHVPLRRLLDLIDVAVMSAADDPGAACAFAQRLRVGEIWATTTQATRRLLEETADGSWRDAVWAGHLRRMEARSPRHERMARWLGPLRTPSPIAAVEGYAALIRDDLAPAISRRTRTARSH